MNKVTQIISEEMHFDVWIGGLILQISALEV